MQWSHDLLTPREHRLFRRLAVFAGGCTLAAASDVTGDSGDEYDTLERLTALHDKSLVFVDRDSQSQPRYRMLETVRQYAEERLNEAGEGDDVRDRHLLHYVALAERASPDLDGPRQAEWYALLRFEQENILGAHAWCANARQGGELALRMCAALTRYWHATYQHTIGIRVAEESLRLAGEDADPAFRFWASWGMAYCLHRLGRYAEALACARASVAAAEASGDAGCVARALSLKSGVLQAGGALDEAVVAQQRACEVVAAADDTAAKAFVLNGLAELHRYRGDLTQARILYERANAMARERGDLRAMMVSLSNLVSTLVDIGDHARACAVFAECVEVMEALGPNAGGICATLDIAAALASALGCHDVAMRFHAAGRVRLRATGMQLEPIDADFAMRWAARSRAALGPAACEAAEAAGRALPYETMLGEIRQWIGADA